MKPLTSSFFLSAGWGDLLNHAFGASTVPPLERGECGWTIFQVGPIRIAYPNFPVGLFDTPTHGALYGLRRAGVHIARLSVPEEAALRAKWNADRLVRLPETVIPDIRRWREDDLQSSVRYELRRGRREGASVRPCSAHDGDALYSLYGHSVSHHRGKTRYTRAYFDGLCKLAQQDPRLVLRIVEDPHGRACGFSAGIADGEHAYYLHAGTDRHCIALRPGYLALASLIESCSAAGCHSFNMLTSPLDQPELRRFKEKMGGTTYARVYRDIAFGPAGLAYLGMLRTALWLQGLRSRARGRRRK